MIELILNTAPIPNATSAAPPLTEGVAPELVIEGSAFADFMMPVPDAVIPPGLAAEPRLKSNDATQIIFLKPAFMTDHLDMPVLVVGPNGPVTLPDPDAVDSGIVPAQDTRPRAADQPETALHGDAKLHTERPGEAVEIGLDPRVDPETTRPVSLSPAFTPDSPLPAPPPEAIVTTTPVIATQPNLLPTPIVPAPVRNAGAAATETPSAETTVAPPISPGTQMAHPAAPDLPPVKTPPLWAKSVLPTETFVTPDAPPAQRTTPLDVPPAQTPAGSSVQDAAPVVQTVRKPDTTKPTAPDPIRAAVASPVALPAPIAPRPHHTPQAPATPNPARHLVVDAPLDARQSPSNSTHVTARDLPATGPQAAPPRQQPLSPLPDIPAVSAPPQPMITLPKAEAPQSGTPQSVPDPQVQAIAPLGPILRPALPDNRPVAPKMTVDFPAEVRALPFRDLPRQEPAAIPLRPTDPPRQHIATDAAFLPNAPLPIAQSVNEPAPPAKPERPKSAFIPLRGAPSEPILPPPPAPAWQRVDWLQVTSPNPRAPQPFAVPDPKPAPARASATPQLTADGPTPKPEHQPIEPVAAPDQAKHPTPPQTTPSLAPLPPLISRVVASVDQPPPLPDPVQPDMVVRAPVSVNSPPPTIQQSTVAPDQNAMSPPVNPVVPDVIPPNPLPFAVQPIVAPTPTMSAWPLTIPASKEVARPKPLAPRLDQKASPDLRDALVDKPTLRDAATTAPPLKPPVKAASPRRADDTTAFAPPVQNPVPGAPPLAPLTSAEPAAFVGQHLTVTADRPLQTHTAPATPVPIHDTRALPHDLPASLVKAASRAAQDDRVELMLDPAELGKVRFEFQTTGDRVQVNLSVERPETLDLLRRNVDALRAEFRDAGFDASTLSFSHWGQNKDDGAQAAFVPQPADLDALTTLDAPSAPRPARNTSDTGLDLRL